MIINYPEDNRKLRKALEYFLGDEVRDKSPDELITLSKKKNKELKITSSIAYFLALIFAFGIVFLIGMMIGGL